jgi:hypothetical protein
VRRYALALIVAFAALIGVLMAVSTPFVGFALAVLIAMWWAWRLDREHRRHSPVPAPDGGTRAMSTPELDQPVGLPGAPVEPRIASLGSRKAA